MLLIQRKFELRHYRRRRRAPSIFSAESRPRKGLWFWFSSKGRLYFCDGLLRDVFDIPMEAVTIWISLHSRPAACRHEAQVKRFGGSARSWLKVTLVDLDQPPPGQVYYRSSFDLDILLKPYLNKTVWVEVEYEA